MKRLRDDQKTKLLLSQKLDEATRLRMEESGGLFSEADLMIARAEERHARIKDRKRRRNGSIAAVVAALVLVSGGYLIGMNSNISASADPDDTSEVLQQGDNIIIGSGISEDDENVGVVTKTYYSLEDVPEDVREEIPQNTLPGLLFQKVRMVYSNNIFCATIIYKDMENNMIEISKECCFENDKKRLVINKKEESVHKEECCMYMQKDTKGSTYVLETENEKVTVFIPEKSEFKIEDILDDLYFRKY